MHTEERKWKCANPTCDKDFKRKADLELHAIVHSGIVHKCTEPGCTLAAWTQETLKDIRNHIHNKPR